MQPQCTMVWNCKDHCNYSFQLLPVYTRANRQYAMQTCHVSLAMCDVIFLNLLSHFTLILGCDATDESHKMCTSECVHKSILGL